MLRKSWFILLGILIFAFALRVINLNQVPMYGDELTMVQDSYSLLKTGHDQTGQYLPLTFSMGAGRPAGYVYFSIPFVAIFGPSIWGVRMLSVLSSLGLILVIFFLGKKFFSQKIGLTAAFLVAISPWSINLGRGGFEANFALFLATLGTYLLLSYKENKLNLLWTTLVWGLAVNTYPTYKVILPILLLGAIWYLGGVKKIILESKLVSIVCGILAVGIIGVTVAQTFTAGSEDRFKDINIFSSNKVAVEQDVNFNREVSLGNGFWGKLFYNKGVSYFSLLRNSYFDNFSLRYLLVSGDGNPRHNMTSTGVIWIIEIVTVSIGLWYLVNKKGKKRELIFLSFWLAIAPLSAIFTLENHGLRTNFMLPSLVMFSSLGILYLSKLKNKLWLGLVLILWFIQFIPTMQRLYFLAPNRFARFWSNMAKEVALNSNSAKSKFDYVIVSTQIDNVEYAYPVYNKIDPGEVLKENLGREKLQGLEFKKFENVYLGTIRDEDLLSFIESIPGTVKYFGPFEQNEIFGKTEILRDNDNVPSVVVYEK